MPMREPEPNERLSQEPKGHGDSLPSNDSPMRIACLELRSPNQEQDSSRLEKLG